MTLIETTLYLFLFSMFVIGALTALSGMQTAANRAAAQVLLLQEGTFLLAKIGTVTENGAGITIRRSGDALTETVSGTSRQISGNQVSIQDYSFVQTNKNGNEPAFADISLSLQTHTNDGSIQRHTFTLRSYITTP